jgi:hypothetical protein
VFHDGEVVKTYPHAGLWLGGLLARIYVLRHR